MRCPLNPESITSGREDERDGGGGPACGRQSLCAAPAASEVVEKVPPFVGPCQVPGHRALLEKPELIGTASFLNGRRDGSFAPNACTPKQAVDVGDLLMPARRRLIGEVHCRLFENRPQASEILTTSGSQQAVGRAYQRACQSRCDDASAGVFDNGPHDHEYLRPEPRTHHRTSREGQHGGAASHERRPVILLAKKRPRVCEANVFGQRLRLKKWPLVLSGVLTASDWAARCPAAVGSQGVRQRDFDRIASKTKRVRTVDVFVRARDPHRESFEDACLGGVSSDEVKRVHGARLTDAIDAPRPLFEPDWIPGQLEIDNHAAGLMQVEALSRRIRGQQNACAA